MFCDEADPSVSYDRDLRRLHLITRTKHPANRKETNDNEGCTSSWPQPVPFPCRGILALVSTGRPMSVGARACVSSLVRLLSASAGMCIRSSERLSGGGERQSRTSTRVARDVEERARIVACIKLGLEESEEVDPESTLHSLEERSGMTLERLVDTPDEFILALRYLVGLGSALVLDSIRRDLLLSSVGQSPLNSRVELFLLALDKDRQSVKASRGLAKHAP
jgi:hypothetical protein